MSLTDKQRAARRLGVGGSDAAAIMGWDDHRDVLDIYASKTIDLPDERNEAMERGNLLEPVIRELAARELGMRIDVVPDTIVHPKRPWMLANLDGRASDGGIFEAKSLDWRKAKDLGEPGSDFCLRGHYAQLQHYMEVTGAPYSYIAYLISAFDLRVFVVERDPAIGRAIADAEERFWNEHVLARVPPSGDVASQLAFNAARWPDATGETLVVTPGSAAEEALIELREAKAAVRAAKAQADAATARVQALMADSPLLTCEFGKVTWKPSKSTAWAQVAKELRAPKDLIAKHTSVGRTFRATLGTDDDE